jgi:glycosyltransferase involved in cell wall biosynthesis
VLNQTRIPNEIIFSENNATDKVKNEVNRLISLHPIIRKVESERPSLSLARNIAIKSASGDLIAFLDDDDIWVKEKLELQVKNIVLMGAVGISSNYYEFNDSEKIIFESKVSLPGSKSWLELLSDQNFFSGGSAAMIRAEVFDRIGYFDESMPACEDHEFWWRMAANGEPLVYLDDILVGVRKNNKNMSDNSTLMLRGNLILFSKILGKKGMSEELVNNYSLKIRHQINLIFSPELFSKIPESCPNLIEAITTYWHLRLWNHAIRLKISSYLYNLSRNDPSYLEEKLIKKPILGSVAYLLRALFILIVVAPIEVVFLFAYKLKKALRLF